MPSKRQIELHREFKHEKRTWITKFRDAFRGLRQSIRQQSSYRAHFACALLSMACCWYLSFDAIRWCLVLLCIGVVIASEMFNTAIETLAKAITRQYDEKIGRALNIASGAVLTISATAAVIGAILFLQGAYPIFMKSMGQIP